MKLTITKSQFRVITFDHPIDQLTVLTAGDADTNPHKDPPRAEQADDEVKEMVGLILPAGGSHK